MEDGRFEIFVDEGNILFMCILAQWMYRHCGINRSKL